MKDLLIIRSVSLQQLDSNIIEIQKKFPNHQISLLAHEHGVEQAKKYKAIDHVYIYPHKESFSFRKKVPDFLNKEFDAVIIPVGNLSGAGFYNVLLYSLTIRAKNRFVCNMVSRIWKTNSFKIIGLGIRNLLYSFLTYLLTLVFGLIALVTLPFLLLAQRKTH